jgi:hypothetical protein
MAQVLLGKDIIIHPCTKCRAAVLKNSGTIQSSNSRRQQKGFFIPELCISVS